MGGLFLVAFSLWEVLGIVAATTLVMEGYYGVAAVSILAFGFIQAVSEQWK